jgi:hypothetical protein
MGDAHYYDWIGDHHFGVPAAIPLFDNQIIYDDNSGDGWSVAKGFAVDVTEGYYRPGRAPCVILSATPLSAGDLQTYALPFGWRAEVQMAADQRATFNFTGKRLFALSPYDKLGGIPPTFTAEAWYIDAEEGYVGGTWTVIIGALTAPTVGSDIAVRYWPPIVTTDCCYCRTSYVRFRVLPMSTALAYYGSDYRAGSRLMRARDRLEARLERLLVPQHVRVFEFAHV